MRLERFLEDELSLGKGSIKMPIHDYIEKQKKAYEHQKRDIKSSVFKVKGKDSWFYHVKIPSASLEDFSYDVLLEFSAEGNSFEDSHIKIFSNSPSFVFSFAYVFYHLDDDELSSKGLIVDRFDKKIPKNKLLIADDKLGEEVLHGYPVMRNPYGIPLFDKTVYMAIFHVLDKHRKGKVSLIKTVSEETLHKGILDHDTLMLLRHKFEIKAKEEKLRKKLSDAPDRVLKGAIRELNKGNNVNVSAANKINVSQSKNVNKVAAASMSVNKIRSGKGSVNRIGSKGR